MGEERERLRATFDEVAALYDEARPGYPAALFDDLAGLSGIEAGGRVLEIGCGTGQATGELARRGFEVVCVELGERLAAVARRNLERYPRARVLRAAFEEWPVEEGAYDLVLSATAWHWLDPHSRCERAGRALRSGGALGLFWNDHVRGPSDTGFFDEVQGVYEREAPELTGGYTGLPLPEEVRSTVAEEIEASGLYGRVEARRYVWEAEYDAASYIRLLNTYSGDLALDGPTRERLHGGIAELMHSRYGGRVRKGYVSTLYMARRL
jgi:SAM-dependent methyltransferase